MQPSLALRTHALGRCWSGAGRTVLHLHIPQASTLRPLHTQDSENDRNDKESSLDAFVLKFQNIFNRPKDFQVKYPAKKGARGKGSRRGKDPKDSSPQISYRPFVKSLGIAGRDKNDRVTAEEIKDEEKEDRLELSDRLIERGEEREKDEREREERVGKNGGKERSGETDGGGNGAKIWREREINTGERPGRTEEGKKERNEEIEDKREKKRREREKINIERTSRREEEIEEKQEKKRGETNKKENNGETKEGRKRENEINRKMNKEEEEEEEEESGRGSVLGEEERAMLCRVLEGVPECRDKEYLEQCLRQGEVPGFAALRRVCAGVSRTAAVGTVVAIRSLAQRLHPHLYLSYLGLDYYWASALCHAGDVEQSLCILLHLHHQTHPHRHSHPQWSKKVCNITQLVLYYIVEEGEEELAKAVDFVDSVANELNSLVPALSLWSATFTSPLFRVQQVSEWLVGRHPRLVKLLGRRMEGLVEKAAWEGDQDLLQRILHLSLCHSLSTHYPSATSALLQLQCDEGDLRGAEETIKFAQRMAVRLTPAALHRFLALLSRNRRPAPLALLALKYQPPPARPPIPPPPVPKYRF